MFVKTCQQCHTLFGTGARLSRLTGSNRANLEYLLSNILDPSAVMAKEYQPNVIVTSDGRVITGIVKQQDADALTVANRHRAGGFAARGSRSDAILSQQSMMPDDLLKNLYHARVSRARGLSGEPGPGAPTGDRRQLERTFSTAAT